MGSQQKSLILGVPRGKGVFLKVESGRSRRATRKSSGLIFTGRVGIIWKTSLEVFCPGKTKFSACIRKLAFWTPTGLSKNDDISFFKKLDCTVVGPDLRIYQGWPSALILEGSGGHEIFRMPSRLVGSWGWGDVTPSPNHCLLCAYLSLYGSRSGAHWGWA